MATLVTNSFTNCGLVNLIEVALASEDANSKVVEVGTVADIDAKKCVDGSWVHILWWCLVEVVKFNLGRDSEASFGQDFEV